MGANDFLPINGTDYIEFYVGNAKQAAYYYQAAFGFQPIAYCGLETGNKEKTSYVVKQGKIRLVFTTSLIPDSEINKHCHDDFFNTEVYLLQAHGYTNFNKINFNTNS